MANATAGCGSQASKADARILNINVGVLGHVDSGKTSLVAALSTHLSTAALDKHPQSKERGITLDLGFSSFTVPVPPRLSHLPYDALQFTLVDCPGHASLIRTIIGGVQIIDCMILVVDVTKGMQVQTAECLVVGEVATPRVVVALNKVDLLPEADRPKLIRKAAKRLASTFAVTKFAGVQMIPVAARPGGGGTSHAPVAAGGDSGAQGVEGLREAVLSLVPGTPRPPPTGPLLFAVDHCFPIKGQGTVLTGTVLQGSVRVGDTVELPALKLTRPVKSMQMFKRPVTQAVKGDRLGLAVTQLDASSVERCLVCTPGTVPTYRAVVARVDKIRFYTDRVPGKCKYHVSVGHTTVMADATFFGLPDGEGVGADQALALLVDSLSRLAAGDPPAFVDTQHYLWQEELYGLDGRPPHPSTTATTATTSVPPQAAPGSTAGEDGGVPASIPPTPPDARHYGPQWALLTFDVPVVAPKDALVIGARLDADVHGEGCRLAFYGRVVRLVDPTDPQQLAALRVYKVKHKQGVVERLQPEQQTAIVKGLFRKETDPVVYTGLQVTTGAGEVGVIEGSFGKSGKLKVHFPGGLRLTGGRTAAHNTVHLLCKRFVWDPQGKKLRQ